MPQYHSGVGGKLTSGATDFAVVDWQFTVTNRTAEVTNAGSAGWAEFITTVTEGAGSANCIWDSTNIPDGSGVAPLDPWRGGATIASGTETVALKLYCGNSTKFYSFNAVIESLQVTSNAQNDAVKFAVTFKATGVITQPI